MAAQAQVAVAWLTALVSPTSSSLTSWTSLISVLVSRFVLLVLFAFALRLVLARLPWLPIVVTLLAVVHWHQVVRGVFSCALGSSTSPCSISDLVRDAGALRLVDSLFSVGLRLAHTHVLVHEFDLPYWQLYLFGSLTVGGVSFWYLHLLHLALDVHAPKQIPRRVPWAADLLAWLEAGALLASFAAIAANSRTLLMNPIEFLAALPFSFLFSPTSSPLVQAVSFEQMLAAFAVIAWYAPRVRAFESVAWTWTLRAVLVAACIFNVTLALSLAISAVRRWPLVSVPTVGVYGLTR